MTYIHSAATARDLPRTEIKTEAKTGRGFFNRLLDSMMESRQRRTEQEIASYLAICKFTDESEREIERRFLGAPSH